jgi:hypothetical protein
MNFDVIQPTTADEIFTLKRAVAKAGKPSFADLVAKPTNDWAGRPERLKGPGIYGVFCRGMLVYVGLYTGTSNRTFSGTVIERWKKHLTYFAMRNPELSFGWENLHRVLTELDGGPVGELAQIIGKRSFTAADRASKLPLNDGYSCTFNKARYAVQNWDLFAPGNEAHMLGEMSFAYARFLPSNADLLGSEVGTAEGKNFARETWLKPREGSLIDKFRPICNDGTHSPRHDVSQSDFMLALIAEMNKPLPARQESFKSAAQGAEVTLAATMITG